MTSSRKQLGQFGEKLASRYLEKLGYVILETNFRSSGGEIDIICRKGESIVIVEVRTRKGSEFGSPEESITTSKKNKLIELGQSYIQEYHDASTQWRIDVVAVEVDRDNKVSRIELIENAVDCE